jgi:DNA-binding NtrC family response regulator
VEDIPELIDLFVKRIAKKYGKTIIKISKLVNEELKNYSWPGNIRELENVIEHAVIVSTSDTIKIKDINPAIINKVSKLINKKENIVSLQEAERSHILKALKLTNWQIHGETGAANILGINPNTLRSRMKKLNIRKR